MANFIDWKPKRGTLNRQGRAYFNRHYRKLVTDGIVQESDWDAFLELCGYHGEVQELRAAIKKEGEIIEDRDGDSRRNPKLIRLRDCESKLIRLTSKFGLDPAGRKRVKVQSAPDSQIDFFQLYFIDWKQWCDSLEWNVSHPIPERFLGHDWSPRDRYGVPQTHTQTADESTLEYRAVGIVTGWQTASIAEREYPKDAAEYALIEEFKRWMEIVDRSQPQPIPQKYLGYRWSYLNSFGEWLDVLPTLDAEMRDRGAAIDAAEAEIRGDAAELLRDVEMV